MKQKKDPLLAKIKMLAAALGPMVEDFAYRYDKERDTYMFTFTMLSASASDSTSDEAVVEKFELSSQEALWYFRGAVDGAFWTMRITQMAAHNKGRSFLS